jgi:hypothetical protein
MVEINIADHAVAHNSSRPTPADLPALRRVTSADFKQVEELIRSRLGTAPCSATTAAIFARPEPNPVGAIRRMSRKCARVWRLLAHHLMMRII